MNDDKNMTSNVKEGSPVGYKIAIIGAIILVAVFLAIVFSGNDSAGTSSTELETSETTSSTSNNDAAEGSDNQSSTSETTKTTSNDAASSTKSTPKTVQSTSNNNDDASNNQPAPKTLTSGYLNYNAAQFQAATASNQQRWLYFHADWCPKCRALDQNITANLNQIPDNVVIFKVDYDSNQDLRREYEVRVQTTIVAIDNQGEVLSRFVGSNTQHTLTELIAEIQP